MAYTVQQVLDKARIPLNDPEKVRYTDSTLLNYFNDAVLLARQKRPDLFLGKLSTYPTVLAATDSFPVADIYIPYFANYLTGMAEAMDDEHVDNSRSSAFVQAFILGIVT